MKRSEVCVIGVGRFGRTLAIELAERHCHVSVVDKSEAAIQSIADLVDYACVGDATDELMLRHLKLDRFDRVYLAVGKEALPSLAVASVLGDAAERKLACRVSSEAHRYTLERVGCAEELDIEAIAAAAVAEEWVAQEASRADASRH